MSRVISIADDGGCHSDGGEMEKRRGIRRFRKEHQAAFTIPKLSTAMRLLTQVLPRYVKKKKKKETRRNAGSSPLETFASWVHAAVRIDKSKISAFVSGI